MTDYIITVLHYPERMGPAVNCPELETANNHIFVRQYSTILLIINSQYGIEIKIQSTDIICFKERNCRALKRRINPTHKSYKFWFTHYPQS
ncbi:hypothetical protein GDO86_008787 [Hymenochirus boettgeri]|uniref:Uncharacterized protein n=1 Tax=Hymenochirus boettgeri TaxID=247094 RepID=A0A8T2IZ32_9PIPI|nr:hypothetical protein GDO86_008787 [Hymenochirus boettgeri]